MPVDFSPPAASNASGDKKSTGFGAIMGHTKPNDLIDLKSVLEKIRALPAVREKSPGVFYFKSIPFLHFHDKDGVRWADVKKNQDWQRLEINFSASSKVQKTFLKDVIIAHELLYED